MKAQAGDSVRLVAEAQSEVSKAVLAAGSEGTVIEAYANPELYAVDVEVPAPELVGGIRFHNVLLSPSQFERI